MVLPVRHIPIKNKCEYFGYEYSALLTNKIKFDKAIIIDFKPNKSKISDEDLINIHANIVNVNTMCNCDSVYKSFKYSNDNAVGKIEEAYSFVVSNLNKD